MALLKRGGARLVDTLTYVAGARQPVRIEVPSRFMQTIWLNVQGLLTVSAVTVPGTVHLDGPANIIAQAELLVDGKTIKIGSGPGFLRVAQVYGQSDGVNNGLVGGAAGIYPFQAVIPLNFEAWSSVSPIDTLLDGRFLKNMVLNITWGTPASLVINNTSTLAVTACTCEVYLEDTEPFDTPHGFWTQRETETTFLNIVTAAQTRLAIPFTPGGVLRAVQLRSVDGLDLSDAVINSLSLRVNGEEFPLNQLEDDFLQAYNRYKFGRDFHAEGYIHLELAENGRIAATGLGAKMEGMAVRDVDIIANTTVGAAGAAATSIVAHLIEHVPPEIMGVGIRPAAKAA